MVVRNRRLSFYYSFIYIITLPVIILTNYNIKRFGPFFIFQSTIRIFLTIYYCTSSPRDRIVHLNARTSSIFLKLCVV